MRRSPLRHPLAILREILGLGQKQLGELVDRSPRTVQAVELGKLALSEDFASTVMRETGVSFQWLREGDPSAPPVARRGGHPYTRADFEWAQSKKVGHWSDADKAAWGQRLCDGLAGSFRLALLLARADAAGDSGGVHARVCQLADDLANELGEDDGRLIQFLRNCHFKLTLPTGKTMELALTNERTPTERAAKAAGRQRGRPRSGKRATGRGV